MRYSLYKKARQQLIDIWLYTAEQWGEVQADKYVDGLYEIFKNMDNASWRKVEDNRFLGVYFLRYEKHFVFFRELSTGHIGIISILHERMNLPERLLEVLPGEGRTGDSKS